MSDLKKISSALISVFHKDGLAPIVQKLNDLGVTIYSTGGTQKFINDLGIDVVAVESVTDYPSILGGRVKTLHPNIFAGLLADDISTHLYDMERLNLPYFDLLICNLYPFLENQTIENIDIGGVSLLRAGSKNFKNIVVLSDLYYI